MESFDWVNILTTDFIETIYASIGMPTVGESESAAAEEAEKTLSRSLSRSLLSSKLTEKVSSIAKSFSDSLMTPMKERVIRQHIFHGEFSSEAIRNSKYTSLLYSDD